MEDPEVEDNIGELVDLISQLTLQGDSTEQAKRQLQWAIEKLIDAKIAEALTVNPSM